MFQTPAVEADLQFHPTRNASRAASQIETGVDSSRTLLMALTYIHTYIHIIEIYIHTNKYYPSSVQIYSSSTFSSLLTHGDKYGRGGLRERERKLFIRGIGLLADADKVGEGGQLELLHLGDGQDSRFSDLRSLRDKFPSPALVMRINHFSSPSIVQLFWCCDHTELWVYSRQLAWSMVWPERYHNLVSNSVNDEREKVSSWVSRIIPHTNYCDLGAFNGSN